MKVSQVAIAVAALVLSATAAAQTTTYTTRPSFEANVLPGSYTETFATPSFSGDPSASFSGGAFSYTVSAPGGLYGGGVFIGTNLPNEALTISFTGAPVPCCCATRAATRRPDQAAPGDPGTSRSEAARSALPQPAALQQPRHPRRPAACNAGELAEDQVPRAARARGAGVPEAAGGLRPVDRQRARADPACRRRFRAFSGRSGPPIRIGPHRPPGWRLSACPRATAARSHPAPSAAPWPARTPARSSPARPGTSCRCRSRRCRPRRHGSRRW